MNPWELNIDRNKLNPYHRLGLSKTQCSKLIFLVEHIVKNENYPTILDKMEVISKKAKTSNENIIMQNILCRTLIKLKQFQHETN